MAPETPELTAAVLFANDLLRTHTIKNAQKLHLNIWRDYANPDKALNAEQISQDPPRAGLLMSAIERTLQSLRPDVRLVIDMRFGLNGNPILTLKEITSQLQISPGKVTRNLQELMYPPLAPARLQLAEFQVNQTTEELASRLQTLQAQRPILPYQNRPAQS